MSLQLNERVWLVGSGALGFGLTDDLDCHVYLLDGGTELALIDAGSGRNTAAILENARRAVGDLDRLKYLLVTHYHADHAGGAADIRERTGVAVAAATGAAEAIRNADEERIQLAAARRVGAYPSEYTFRPCPVDAEVADGDELIVGDLRLRAIETPGHCDWHMSFYGMVGGQHVLFDADCIFFGGKVCLQAIPDCRIDAYAASARRLSALPVDMLCPGHLEIALSGGARHLALATACFDRLVPPPNIIS